MPKQRRRQDEKAPANGRLVDLTPSSSLLSVQRSEDGEQEYPQRMNNPKQQLQKANTYGFNFGNIPIYPAGQSGQRGELGQERSHPHTRQAPIQAKRALPTIQRDRAVQDGLADIKSSGKIASFGEWKLANVVTIPSVGAPTIKDPVRFNRLCQFAQQEEADENTNALLLASRANWYSAESLMALAETICLNSHMDPSDYKYQRHLPRINYPTAKPPEDINMSGPLAIQICQAYAAMEAASIEDRDAYVDAMMVLSNKITSAIGEAWSFLNRGVFKGFKDQLDDEGYSKADSIHTALSGVWGGARKRRILGGYHEGARR